MSTEQLRLFAIQARDVLKAYELWEANLVLSEEAWKGGIADFPTLTESLYDELLECQRLRNHALEVFTTLGLDTNSNVK
jgi:hypothetical protein